MVPILATLAKLLGRLEVRFMDMVCIYIYGMYGTYIYIFGDGFTKQLLLQMGGTNV